MKIRTTLLSTLIAAALVATVPAISSAQRSNAQGVNEREHNQKVRVVRGAKSGNLTKKETARLAAQQARIRAFEARNRRDGDGYSARERARTQRRQNEASRDIFRKKHNDRDRG